MKSLPDRLLRVDELKALDQSDAFEQAAPITARIEDGDTLVASAVFLTETEAIAVVFNDGWHVLQRETRPTPPQVLEDAIAEYMSEHYPEHERVRF